MDQLEILLGHPNDLLAAGAILPAKSWWTIRVLPEYAVNQGDRVGLTRAGRRRLPCHGSLLPGPTIRHFARALLSVLTSHSGFGYPVPRTPDFSLWADA